VIRPELPNSKLRIRQSLCHRSLDRQLRMPLIKLERISQSLASYYLASSCGFASTAKMHSGPVNTNGMRANNNSKHQGRSHCLKSGFQTVDVVLESINFGPFTFPLHCGVLDKEVVLNKCKTHRRRSISRERGASRWIDFPARSPETTPGAGMLPGMQRHQLAGCPCHLS